MLRGRPLCGLKRNCVRQTPQFRPSTRQITIQMLRVGRYSSSAALFACRCGRTMKRSTIFVRDNDADVWEAQAICSSNLRDENDGRPKKRCVHGPPRQADQASDSKIPAPITSNRDGGAATKPFSGRSVLAGLSHEPDDSSRHARPSAVDLALFGPHAMSGLRPECAPKRTSADQSEFMGSHPRSPGPPDTGGGSRLSTTSPSPTECPRYPSAGILRCKR